MSRNRTDTRHRIRVVQTNVPAWLALLLVLPAAVLFAVSLALVVGVGLVGALLLPLVWRRVSQRSGGGDYIELDPRDFHTVKDRNHLPPPDSDL